jgi:6-phosphogluconolactonase
VRRLALWMSCLVLAGHPFAPAARAAEAETLYVGTYTKGNSTSKGIYRLRLDLATGALAVAGEPTESVNPSFLALHPSGRFLYAVNETGDSRKDEGGVSAYAIDAKTGALTFLNRQPSGGGGPCHLSLDKKGRHVLVANYDGGSVSVHALGVDGRLGVRTAFVQHEPTAANPVVHAHSIDLDAANRFALVADLGLDRLFVYGFDAVEGALAPHASASLPTKSGPRHLAWHPDGRHAYVINETSSRVTAFAYDAKAGTLAELQSVSTLPDGFTGSNTTAEIAVTPDGRFLYGSNRGHDSLAIFAVDPATGKLTPAGHQPTLGKKPRHFAIDPTGAFLLAANQESEAIAVFRIDRTTGALTAVGQPVSVPRPVCLLFIRPGADR